VVYPIIAAGLGIAFALAEDPVEMVGEA